MIGAEFASDTVSYDEQDVSLYALSIGAPADPLDDDELKFVYEGCSSGFQVIPTFAVNFARSLLDNLSGGEFAGLRYEPMMLGAWRTGNGVPAGIAGSRLRDEHH